MLARAPGTGRSGLRAGGPAGLLAFALALASVGCLGSEAGSATLPYVVRRVFPDLAFEMPVFLAESPDRTGRLFVVEKAGRIRVFDREAPNRSRVFLDITDRVASAGSGDERGLLGLAFDPDFAANGHLYVNYTAMPQGSPTRISRFTAGGEGRQGAAASSEEVLLAFEQPWANHNGGWIGFGPDRMLYVATGDGGAGGDPRNVAQDLGSLLGKILRIDVSRRDPELRYAIPEDNPFRVAGKRPEIWAYGLRNPWRCSFDRLTSALWCGDVGQNAIEEVDRIERGANYGWRVMEGSSCYGNPQCKPPAGAHPPKVEYDRRVGMSITGGYAYRGTRLPELAGTYLYGDYVRTTIFGMRRREGSRPGNPEGHSSSDGFYVVPIARAGFPLSSFGEDASGEVYLVDYGRGGLYVLDPAPAGSAPGR